MTRRGWILFAAMALIWGIPYLFIKVAVAELTPATLVFFRSLIGASLLLPLAVARKDLAPLRPYWKWILAYTFVEVAAPWFLLSDAERRISSSLTGLLIAAVPSIGAVLALVTGGTDRLDWRRIVGLVLGFVGVAALVGLDVRADDLGAIGQVALVTVGYAIGPMIIERKLGSLPSLGVVAASLGITVLVYAPFALTQLPSTVPSTSVIFAVVVLGVVCTALAFVLFFALITEVGAPRATVITYVNPAVALAFGVTLLHEPFTVGIAIGFVLIVFGSFLATRRTAPSSRGVSLSEERPQPIRTTR
ncbi:MAG TPA: DMT family transporter [Candidatus Polarisedimenticolia bacterium]|nr:DMT family transporter [Candidatus Polarisedimenticolia bacterium]